MTRRNKLSPTQETILESIRRQVNQARSYTTYEDYFLAVEAPHYNCDFNTPEKYQAQDPKGWAYRKKHWEGLLEGKALTHCSGPTLYKLEKLGYIKILKDTTKTKDTIDTVQLIEN